MTIPPPSVSVVITAYNAERFIGACVRAALTQNYANFEVLVVDDGSTDGTAQICKSTADPRLRYLSWGRLGRPRALNAAVAAARGDYIAINDADDLSFPHRLAYTIDFLCTHPGVAFVGTRFAATDVFLDSVPPQIPAAAAAALAAPAAWPSRTALFQRNFFNNSTLVYPKSTWLRVGGYDEGLSNSEDYDFYLRAMQCGPAALLPGQTILWYTNPHGFFKNKSHAEHLQALRLIKRRAHILLALPRWLRWHQACWEVGLRARRRWPVLLRAANAIRRLAEPKAIP